MHTHAHTHVHYFDRWPCCEAGTSRQNPLMSFNKSTKEWVHVAPYRPFTWRCLSLFGAVYGTRLRPTPRRGQDCPPRLEILTWWGQAILLWKGTLET